MFCKYCGNQLPEDAKFCPKCGKITEEQEFEANDAFEKQENLVHYFHDDDGYMTGETQDYGPLQTLPLPEDFLQEGRTLIFKGIASRKVWLSERGGKKLAEITFDGFENLLVWHAGKAPFICIEPWTNLPDPANKADVEFSAKGGVIEVLGETEKTLVRTIAYE